MEVNHYKCATCGHRMHSKNRFGSSQFQSGSMILQGYQSHMLGRIVDDPGRPAARWAPEGTDLPYNEMPGWRATEEKGNGNFCMFYRSFNGKIDMSEKMSQLVQLKLEDSKDLELRLSIPETEFMRDKDDIGKSEKQIALEVLDNLVKALSPVFDQKPIYGDALTNAGGLTESDVQSLKCYLIGGHDWKLEFQVDGDKITIDNREKEDSE